MTTQGTGNMSKAFKDQEQQNEVDKANSEGVEAEDRTIVFWAPSPGYKIGNFVKEEFSGGRLIQAEVSLSFLNHICVGDPKTKKGRRIIEFIREADAFEAGVIKECENGMKQAALLTAQWRSALQVTELTAEDISCTQHILKD